MAATLALTLTLSSETPQPQQRHPFFYFPPNHKHLYLYSVPKPHSLTTFSHSHSSLSATTTAESTTTGSTTYPGLEDSFGIERSLSNEELEKLKILEGFNFGQELPTGSLWIRAMRREDMDITVRLLADSFAESILLPAGYESVLRFFLKQYLLERKAVLPHAVTLIGFYKSKEQEEEEFAGTVEVCFDEKGAHASPPTPTPPKNSPYICNVTVKKSLRRKGIGWTLIKASEELISQMSCTKEVYLHCRLIDSVPFNMYVKAGYNVLRTDSMWILLLLQRRKHLMFKNLVDSKNSPEPDTPDIDSVHSSQLDMQMS